MIQTAGGSLAATVRSHVAALHASSELTAAFRRMYRPMAAEVKPERVIEVLQEAGVIPVLMGTHGLGGYRSEPRATQDVDVLVTKKDLKKAVRALQQAFPGLKLEDHPVVTRFIDPETGRGVIDVMKPILPVYQMVFRYTIAVGGTHRIPDLEMMLASKFAAMTSPNRNPAKKLVDGGDFTDVVQHNRTSIDLGKLRRLADKVYPGGGAEIMQMVETIDAGGTLQL